MLSDIFAKLRSDISNSINKEIELHKQEGENSINNGENSINKEKSCSINLLNLTLEINEITIPRGLETKLIILLSECAINYSIIDNRIDGRKINISFKGELREKQQLAFEEMNKFDNGVLSATTGFGKTVIGARIIAEKKTSTLILVHTKELAMQWKERLEQFLEIDEKVQCGKMKAS